MIAVLRTELLLGLTVVEHRLDGEDPRWDIECGYCGTPLLWDMDGTAKDQALAVGLPYENTPVCPCCF